MSVRPCTSPSRLQAKTPVLHLEASTLSPQDIPTVHTIKNFLSSDRHIEKTHDSQKSPTGLAGDSAHNLYLTYPCNTGQTADDVGKCTSHNEEQPWPSRTMQTCIAGQDPSTCFINIQNIVRIDRGRPWVIESGIPYNATPTTNAIHRGAKLISFNETTAEQLCTYIIPHSLLSHRLNMDDMRVNSCLGGREGYAFITDASKNSSLLAVDLENGNAVRRLFNTSVVRADENYVGTYNGEPIYSWTGTQKGHLTTAADGIALGKMSAPSYHAGYQSLFKHRVTFTGVFWHRVASTTSPKKLL